VCCADVSQQPHQVIADAIRRAADHLKPSPGAPPARSSPISTTLAAARDRELERYEAEIEHYVASLESAAACGAPAAASYTFHGNVGAASPPPNWRLSAFKSQCTPNYRRMTSCCTRRWNTFARDHAFNRNTVMHPRESLR
jgi:hypothetical protein